MDPRADIWAFGVVLPEMLTGRPLFAGPTVSDTLAAVLKTEPDLSAIPPHLRPALERCLRKDPRRRWRSIGDVRISLEDGVPPVPPPTAAPGRSILWPMAAAVLAAALLAAGGLLWRATRPSDRPLMRLSVDLGPDALTGLNLTAAISPDGRRLVFPIRGPDGKQRLATRLLDQAQSFPLAGTEDARDPSFSQDGQWIAFFARFQLKKISVQGGTPVTLGISSNTGHGVSWAEDGSLAASMGVLSPVSRIPAADGPRQLLTKLGPGEGTHRWPQILPGGGAILFTASPSANGMENASIEALSLKTGQVKILQRDGYFGRYLPSGHLVSVHQGALFGVAFDPSSLEMHGTPVPLLDDVAGNATTGGGQFDFSRALSGPGTFVYVAGKSAAQSWQMAWLDQTGKMQPFLATEGIFAVPRFSPDGHKLAFLGESADIYVHDLERDTTARLTFTGHAGPVVWAPDSKHILVQSIPHEATFEWLRSDGAGDRQRLLESANAATPWSISPDGRHVAYFETARDSGLDLWTLPLDTTDPDHPKPGKPELFLRTPADENVPRFSPDGRWIAHRSNESGTSEIYVRPFPARSGGKWQISAAPTMRSGRTMAGSCSTRPQTTRSW